MYQENETLISKYASVYERGIIDQKLALLFDVVLKETKSAYVSAAAHSRPLRPFSEHPACRALQCSQTEGNVIYINNRLLFNLMKRNKIMPFV